MVCVVSSFEFALTCMATFGPNPLSSLGAVVRLFYSTVEVTCNNRSSLCLHLHHFQYKTNGFGVRSLRPCCSLHCDHGEEVRCQCLFFARRSPVSISNPIVVSVQNP